MEPANGVAGYFRVSLARDNMVAPTLYEDEIRRYCNYRHLVLERIYSDIDHSAFRGAKARPGLEELVKDRSNYAQIVVPKLSRFGRSMKELIRLFDVFDSDAIPLVFLDMNLDTSTSQGRLLRHILAAFAEYESDVKADYARANHRRIRAEGKPWGIAPYGYRKGERPSTWVLDGDHAAVVRAIFTRYASGSSANAVARELNVLGATTVNGRTWKGQAIGKILDNPAYAALSVVDDGLVEARWPAIVSEATWSEVRRRRESDPRRISNLGKRKPWRGYLLSGLMWCGQCGRKMTHTTSTRGRPPVYVCSGGVWANWQGCPNARVYEDLANGDVAGRFLERCAFTILTEKGARGGSPRSVWDEASLPEQQRLLGLVIERIVATPLTDPVPRGERATRLGHRLDITWKADLDAGEEIVVVAEEAPPRQLRQLKFTDGRYQMFRAQELARLIEKERAEEASDDRISEAAGVSWGQWRKARLLPR